MTPPCETSKPRLLQCGTLSWTNRSQINGIGQQLGDIHLQPFSSPRPFHPAFVLPPLNHGKSSNLCCRRTTTSRARSATKACCPERRCTFDLFNRTCNFPSQTCHALGLQSELSRRVQRVWIAREFPCWIAMVRRVIRSQACNGPPHEAILRSSSSLEMARRPTRSH